MFLAADANVLGGNVKDDEGKTDWGDGVEDEDATVSEFLCGDERMVVEAVVGVEHVESEEEGE